MLYARQLNLHLLLLHALKNAELVVVNPLHHTYRHNTIEVWVHNLWCLVSEP